MINDIVNFIKINIYQTFWEIHKTRERQIQKNCKNYKLLAKSAPRLANKLLWTEEVQKEDPYKLIFLNNLVLWACITTFFFWFFLYIIHLHLFAPYNQVFFDWFLQFWPKKISWIYGKWFLNKHDFLTNRAFTYVVTGLFLPMIITNSLYFLFEHFIRKNNKIHYRLMFFKFLFIVLFIVLGILLFDLSHIFLLKNILWSLELTLQDSSKHVTEAFFIIFDKVDFWFFTIIKFYSFMSYYTVHILLVLCNLLACIFYNEWCMAYIDDIDWTSQEFVKQVQEELELEEILSDNTDYFDNNK